jgi:MATE family multidrug resistance protein
VSLGLDGFANAAEALVGKAIGAQSRTDFTKAVRITMAWSVFLAIVFTAVFAAGGARIIHAITDIPEVRSMAYRYLPWLVLLPIVSVWCFMFDGIFVGGTRAVEMRNAMLFSTFLFFLPAWYFLQPLGNDGLWLAFLLFMAARGITMWLLYVRIERGAVGFVRVSGPTTNRPCG